MAEFTDQSLTPRARRMAQWLCDSANSALHRPSREASCDMLLAELPDHWTADDAERMAREFREQLGPRASHRAWLTAAGWLVGEEERLPERPSQRMSEASRMAAQRRVRDILAQMGAPAVLTWILALLSAAVIFLAGLVVGAERQRRQRLEEIHDLKNELHAVHMRVRLQDAAGRE